MEKGLKRKDLRLVVRWAIVTVLPLDLDATDLVGEGVVKFEMSRPCRRRRIRGNPDSFYFKPAGIRKLQLEEVFLEMDEFEAIRLVDSMELSQDEAGVKMDVSQSTLSRILKSGRGKVADAVCNGKAIRIEK